jgi:hypothetical protein
MVKLPCNTTELVCYLMLAELACGLRIDVIAEATELHLKVAVIL